VTLHLTRHRATLVVATLAVVAVAAGCGGSGSGGQPSHASDPSGSGGGSLTVYNGQHEATTKALVAGFEKKTGIDVSVRSGETSELANQIVAEGKASPSDVFYAEYSPALTALQDKGRLAKVDQASLEQVPAKDSSAQGRWLGVTARVRMMVYDPAKVDKSELPSSVLDLAKPAWKGRIGIETTSGSLQAMITAIRLTDGKDTSAQWLKGIKRNAKTFNSHDAILKAVNSGRVDAGLMPNYYWYRLRDEIGKQKMHARRHYFTAGDPGSLLIISGAAIVDSAPHPKAAQRFLAYMVSAAGQKVIESTDSYEYPLNSKVPDNSALTPLDKIDPLRVSADKLGHGLDETIAQVRQVGLI
jgi:iron(III) transport system substrate-binding protein